MEALFAQLPKGVRRSVRKDSRKVNNNQKEEVSRKMRIIRYHNFDTLKQKKDHYVELDEEFIEDVRAISVIKQDLLSNFRSYSRAENELTSQQLDEIDFKARLHSDANTVNSNSSKDYMTVENSNRCECGCERAKGEQIPACHNEEQLYFLGPGVVLHFMYMKFVIITMLLITLVYGTFALTTNLAGNNADFTDCTGAYCRFQVATSNENKLNPAVNVEIQGWLGTLLCLLWLIAVRVIKYYGKVKNQLIDQGLISAADNAIKISNLPQSQFCQLELISHLDTLYQKLEVQSPQENQQADYSFDPSSGSSENKEFNRFNLKSIQIIYNMEFSRKLLEQIFQQCVIINSLLQEDEKGRRNLVCDHAKYRSSKNRLKQTYQFLNDLRKKFLNDPAFRKELSTTCCLLEFHSEKDKNRLLKNYGKQKIGIIKELQQRVRQLFKSQSKAIIFRGKVLRMERAPQPSDILWQNCQKSFSLVRIACIYVVTFTIVVVSFGIYTGLDFVQEKLSNNQGGIHTHETYNLVIMSMIMSIALQIINKFIWSTMFYLLQLEYNHTLTDKIISQMNKTLFSSSLNVIVLPLISSYFIRNKIYSSDGVNGQAFDFQISFLAVSLVKGIDPVAQIKRLILFIRKLRNRVIRLCCAKSSTVNPEKGVPEVNTFYEGSYFDIAENYVTLNGAIFHAIFYCHLQPCVLPLVMVMACTFYWGNKIRLLRSCKIPELTDYLIFETALSQANIIPLIYGLGTIILSYIQSQKYPQMPFIYIPSTICMFMGLLFIGNPGDIFNKLTTNLIEQFNACCDSNQIKQQEQPSAAQLQKKRISVTSNLRKKRRVSLSTANCNNDTYYEDSNSLTLLGFEASLKGEPVKNMMAELRRYCESFVAHTDQKVIRDAALKFLFGAEGGTIIQPNKSSDSGAQSNQSPKKNPRVDLPPIFPKNGFNVDQNRRILARISTERKRGEK